MDYSNEGKEMEMYNQMLLQSKMLDFKMLSLQSNISGKTEEIARLERTLIADNDDIERIQKEISGLEDHEASVKRNIEILREGRFTLEGLKSSLVQELNTTEEKNKNTKSNHDEIIHHYMKKWDNYEKVYNSLPWVKERNKLKIELAFSKIELNLARKKLFDEEEKVKLFREISIKRYQTAIIKFVERMICRDKAYKKIEDQKNYNRQLKDDIEKLKTEINMTLELLTARAKNAVAHVKERAERHMAKKGTISLAGSCPLDFHRLSLSTPVTKFSMPQRLALSSPSALRKRLSENKTLTFNPYNSFGISEPPLALKKLLQPNIELPPTKSNPVTDDKTADTQTQQKSVKPLVSQKSTPIETMSTEDTYQKGMNKCNSETVGATVVTNTSQEEVASQPETEVTHATTSEDATRVCTPRPMFERKNIALVNAQNTRFFRPGLELGQATSETTLPPKRHKKLVTLPELPPPITQPLQQSPSVRLLPEHTKKPLQEPLKPPAQEPQHHQSKHVKFANPVSIVSSEMQSSSETLADKPKEPHSVSLKPAPTKAPSTTQNDQEKHSQARLENEEFLNYKEPEIMSQSSEVTSVTLSPNSLMNESARQAYFDNIMRMSPDYRQYRRHSELNKGDLQANLPPSSDYFHSTREGNLQNTKMQEMNEHIGTSDPTKSPAYNFTSGTSNQHVGAMSPLFDGLGPFAGSSSGTSDFGLLFGTSKDSDKNKQSSTSNFFNLNF